MAKGNYKIRNLKQNITLEQFQKMAIEELGRILPEEPDISLEPVTIVKMNDQEMYGVAFRSDFSRAAPTYYIDRYYDRYLRGEALHDMMMEVYKAYLNCTIEPPDSVEADMPYSKIRKKLTFRLLDMSLNSKYFEKVPYMPVGNDLALVCDITVDSGRSGMWKVTVSNAMVESGGFDEKELFRDAMANAPKVEPEIMSETFDDTGIFVLSTKSCRFGAAALFYPHMLERLADRTGGDYFVIPASVHEVMIVPADEIQHLNDMLDVVRESNCNIGRENVLTGNILFYDCEDNALVTVDRAYAREYEREHGVAS